MMTSTPSEAATKATYNKEQLLNFYRAISSQIQEPPENLKHFPVILSSKLLQPVNETNLHLFDTDYVSNSSNSVVNDSSSLIIVIYKFCPKCSSPL